MNHPQAGGELTHPHGTAQAQPHGTGRERAWHDRSIHPPSIRDLPSEAATAPLNRRFGHCRPPPPPPPLSRGLADGKACEPQRCTAFGTARARACVRVTGKLGDRDARERGRGRDRSRHGVAWPVFRPTCSCCCASFGPVLHAYASLRFGNFAAFALLALVN